MVSSFTIDGASEGRVQRAARHPRLSDAGGHLDQHEHANNRNRRRECRDDKKHRVATIGGVAKANLDRADRRLRPGLMVDRARSPLLTQHRLPPAGASGSANKFALAWACASYAR
jgi:hypothetical protein